MPSARFRRIRDFAREATVQIKPADGLDMDAALDTAARIVSGFAGVRGAKYLAARLTGFSLIVPS